MKTILTTLMCLLGVAFGEVRYMCELEISQSTLTLDIWQHVKDSANSFSISLPVDKQFYESITIGETLASNHKSFLINGSFKSVNVVVKDKRVIHENADANNSKYNHRLPEPSTFALSLFGLSVLCYRRVK